MRIAVCDDELVYTRLIADHLKLITQMQAIDACVFQYTDPSLLLTDHRSSPFDAIFLDIDMPSISGFAVAETIRTCTSNTYIIFVTAKHELVYESFEYTPFYFLCKASENDLKRDLNHVMRKLMLHFRQDQTITVQDFSFGPTIVAMRDICYIRSDKHYLLYHTSHSAIPYKERGTIASREIEYFAYRFIKPHQRYLVNMTHIERFDTLANTITLVNGETIPVSKKEKDEAFRKFKEYKRK